MPTLKKCYKKKVNVQIKIFNKSINKKIKNVERNDEKEL